MTEGTTVISMLENDLYKFSMSYYYQRTTPEGIGTFNFTDRNKQVFTREFVDLLNEEFQKLSSLALTDDEFEWCLKNIYFIPRCYFEWLKGFRFDPSIIKAYLDDEGHLHVFATDLIYKVTLYEIPILSIISELYYKHMNLGEPDWNFIENQLAKKVALSNENGIKFANFGMRRRYSHKVEDMVTGYLAKNAKYFVGSSTVYFAMKYQSIRKELKPIGTMAHELMMSTAAFMGPKEANYYVMRHWADIYGGALGTMLTDCFTTDVFLRNFSMDMAKLYDGVRHDSGDPFEFGDKIIAKYKSYNIDPLTKSIVFSDALDFERALAIQKYFEGRIKVSFGIGTNLTNDVGEAPLNIVMKLKSFQVNPRQPEYRCVKLSDVAGKELGDPDEIHSYKAILGLI
ncbi:MAG: nicotinate phosphoribosyltransferase [Bacteroidaceae bacterium]|nr:nicotinate phosphoribosyltransferase [Bacteroidaceae bacterium]